MNVRLFKAKEKLLDYWDGAVARSKGTLNRQLVLYEEGFEVVSKRSSRFTTCDSIQKIIAKQYDYFTIDVLVIYVLTDSGCSLQIADIAPEFLDLLAWLDKRGLVTNPDWYVQASWPPFASTHVTVFDRDTVAEVPNELKV